MRTVLLEKSIQKRRRPPAASVLLSELEARKLLSTWTGGTSSWNTSSNWTPNGVPSFSDDAVLPSGSAAINVDGGDAVSSVTVEGSYSLTLNAALSAGTLDVSGTVALLAGSDSTVGTTLITANPTGGPGNILIQSGVTANSFGTAIGTSTGGNGNLHVQGGGKLSTQAGLYLGNSTGYGGLIIDGGGEVSGFVDAELNSWVHGAGDIVGDFNEAGGTIASGSFSAVDSLVVHGDAFLNAGFTMFSQFQTTADANGHYANALVVTDTAYIAGTLDSDVSILGSQLDSGGFNPGDMFPLIVAHTISGSFTDYTWRDYLPSYMDSYLPTLSYVHWALDIVPANVNSGYDYDLDPEGSDYALVLTVVGSGGRSMMMSSGSEGGEESLAAAPDSSRASVSESVPAAKGLTVSAVAIDSVGIQLQWNKAGNYEIQRQANDGSWLTVRVGTGSNSQWTDLNVKTGVSYRYRISALDNDALSSELSDAIGF